MSVSVALMVAERRCQRTYGHDCQGGGKEIRHHRGADRWRHRIERDHEQGQARIPRRAADGHGHPGGRLGTAEQVPGRQRQRRDQRARHREPYAGAEHGRRDGDDDEEGHRGEAGPSRTCPVGVPTRWPALDRRTGTTCQGSMGAVARRIPAAPPTPGGPTPVLRRSGSARQLRSAARPPRTGRSPVVVPGRTRGAHRRRGIVSGRPARLGRWTSEPVRSR